MLPFKYQFSEKCLESGSILSVVHRAPDSESPGPHGNLMDPHGWECTSEI